jgi:hypothetical protein
LAYNDPGTIAAFVSPPGAKMRYGPLKVLTAQVFLLLLPVLAQAAPHNLILFVPDGLRSQVVDRTTAPTLARLRDDGVDFTNSHSLFPTFTTANASAFATGHRLGDTGDFSNTIYTGFPIKILKGSVTPYLENDPVLREVNDDFASNYLNEQSIVAAARLQGYSTALIGKLGPAAISLSMTAPEPRARKFRSLMNGRKPSRASRCPRPPPRAATTAYPATTPDREPGFPTWPNNSTFSKPR